MTSVQPTPGTSASPLTIDDLLRPFHDAETDPADNLVGTEAEKFGVLADGAAIPFEGDRSVQRVLNGLADGYGWQRKQEVPGAPFIALLRDGASITLEPAGQLELSGAPLPNIHETKREMDTHLAELQAVSAPLGIEWLALGFHPFASHDDLPDVPKLRYGVMREYLPTKGARALDMMRRTCTVQANLDFANEADAMRKLRVSLRLQPIITAMFMNSPWLEGAHQGRLGERADVWLHMDPDRSGLLPFAWEPGATYADYVQWALDVPMFLVLRDGKILPNTGQTFRDYMRDGFQGAQATVEDWETHLNTLFPEVRLKRTLELRGADSQRRDTVCALPALARGLLYDDDALSVAEALASRLGYDDVSRARPNIARVGMRAELAGRPVAEWADEVLGIAEAGLDRLNVRNELGQTERVHLLALRALVDGGACPADFLRARLPEDRPSVADVIEASRV